MFNINELRCNVSENVWESQQAKWFVCMWHRLMRKDVLVLIDYEHTSVCHMVIVLLLHLPLYFNGYKNNMYLYSVGMGMKVAQKWDFLSFSSIICVVACCCIRAQTSIHMHVVVSRAHSSVWPQCEWTFVEPSTRLYFSAVSWTNWQTALWAESLVQID